MYCKCIAECRKSIHLWNGHRRQIREGRPLRAWSVGLLDRAMTRRYQRNKGNGSAEYHYHTVKNFIPHFSISPHLQTDKSKIPSSEMLCKLFSHNYKINSIMRRLIEDNIPDETSRISPNSNCCAIIIHNRQLNVKWVQPKYISTCSYLTSFTHEIIQYKVPYICNE